MSKKPIISWLPYTKEWQSGNLNRAEFCRQQELHYVQFCYHCQAPNLCTSSNESFFVIDLFLGRSQIEYWGFAYQGMGMSEAVENKEKLWQAKQKIIQMNLRNK